MCGTPRASRATMARAEMGAAMVPEVFGRVRQPNQYKAPRSAPSKTAMLRLSALRKGV